MNPFLSGFEFDASFYLDSYVNWGFLFRYLTRPAAILNRGDAMRRNFEFTVEFFVSKAKLGDGSVRDIERDTIVRLEVEFSEIDPQELQILEEKVVKNVVETL